MKTLSTKIKPLCSALIVAGLLSACGGGGGGTGNQIQTGNGTSSGGGTLPSTNPPSSDPPPPTADHPAPGDTSSNVPVPGNVSAPMMMSCIDGANYQCSGASLIRSDNGVALTSSGVQVYGKSTSDLQPGPRIDPTAAYGLAPASGGIAEFRLAKDGKGVISSPALLLNNIGITWDGKKERPQIVDVFQDTYGRVELDASGKIVPRTLPPSSDLGFYDFAYNRGNAKQENYANNRYFPRTEPTRCAPGTPVDKCYKVEVPEPLRYQPGDWSSGGRTPDWASIQRRHGDGDVHAGDNKPGSNPPWLEGGTGYGVPFAGSKGYRSFENWGLRYGNLGTWITQDTVNVVEWTGGPGSEEHNQIRRGMVAYGDVSDPAAVPAAGSASYSGIAYGWYGAGDPNKDPGVFWGAATVTVNFATREVLVIIENTVSYDSSNSPIPVASFRASTKMGAAGQSVANYLTGPVDNGTLKGGVSGRYFGPIAAGAKGTGPAEVGGAFTLSNSTSGQAIIGGFIARRQ